MENKRLHFLVSTDKNQKYFNHYDLLEQWTEFSVAFANKGVGLHFYLLLSMKLYVRNDEGVLFHIILYIKDLKKQISKLSIVYFYQKMANTYAQ